MVQDIPFGEIKIGDKASIIKTVTETDLSLFAQITGDVNPVHLDEEYAKKTIFKTRIAHGMLTASFISAVLGTTLPGANTIYVSQELVFKAPVKIGETVTATVEVMEKVDRRRWIILKTTVVNQDGIVVVDGKATVMKR
jgi:3-hydroxybutyryl-CoA dehydratase